jgi:hypothetical protein
MFPFNQKERQMPTFTTRIERLLKKTDKMRQQAVKGLVRTLKHIDQERKQRTADLEEAAKLVIKQLSELGHSVGINTNTNRKAASTKTVKMVRVGRKRRIRRDPEQLKGDAEKALAMIRKAGKEGIGGAEIRKSVPGVGQNIKAFLEKNADVKLKTTGQRSAMRYFAS